MHQQTNEKSMRVVEQKANELLIDYIHLLSSRFSLPLSDLYSLREKPRKKAAKAKTFKANGNLISRLTIPQPTLHVHEKGGYLIHTDTQFVIKPERSRYLVIGKLSNQKGGEGLGLHPLTVDDIEVCKQLNLGFRPPSNLAASTVSAPRSSAEEMAHLYRRLCTSARVDDECDDEEDEED